VAGVRSVRRNQGNWTRSARSGTGPSAPGSRDPAAHPEPPPGSRSTTHCQYLLQTPGQGQPRTGEALFAKGEGAEPPVACWALGFCCVLGRQTRYAAARGGGVEARAVGASRFHCLLQRAPTGRCSPWSLGAQLPTSDCTDATTLPASLDPDRSGFEGVIRGFRGSFRGVAADVRKRAKPLRHKAPSALARVSRCRRCSGSNLPPSA